nr:MAG TPA: hypothetical protein [Caudoviricetes sp.]
MVRVVPGTGILDDLIYTKEIRVGIDEMIVYNIRENLEH